MIAAELYGSKKETKTSLHFRHYLVGNSAGSSQCFETEMCICGAKIMRHCLLILSSQKDETMNKHSVWGLEAYSKQRTMRQL